MSGITIISDGTAFGTKVMVGDKFMSGVTKIEIAPIVPNEVITAKITVDLVSLRLHIRNAEIECADAEMAGKIQAALLRVTE